MADQKYEIEIGARLDKLEAAVNGAVAQVQRLADRFEDAGVRGSAGLQKMEQAASRVSSMGRTLTVAVTLPLLGAAGASLKFAADFQSAMQQSVAIMGPLDAAMRQTMDKTARDVAKSTVFSATQSAEAFYFLASAGLTAQQSVAALPQVAQFAQAGMFDLAKATEYLMDSQSALGLRSQDTAENLKNMTRVSDVLVKAAVASNASVEQFATALTHKGATAMKTFNISIEEGVAVLAAYADQGIKGQRAGERFEIVTRELTRSALENAAAFKTAGIQVFDAQGRLSSFATIVKQLEKFLGGMSQKQKVVALDMLGFTQETKSAILALVGVGDKISDYEKALRSAGGATKDIADKQMQAFTAQLGKLRKELEDVAITLGTTLMPILLKFAQSYIKPAIGLLAGFADGFAQAPGSMQLTVIAIVALVAAAGPLLYLLGGVWSGMLALTQALIALTPAVIGLTVAAAPFLVVILKIAAAFAAGWAIGAIIRDLTGLGAWMDKITAKAAVWLGGNMDAEAQAIAQNKRILALRAQRGEGGGAFVGPPAPKAGPPPTKNVPELMDPEKAKKYQTALSSVRGELAQVQAAQKGTYAAAVAQIEAATAKRVLEAKQIGATGTELHKLLGEIQALDAAQKNAAYLKAMSEAMGEFFDEAAQARDVREDFSLLGKTVEDVGFDMGMLALKSEKYGGATAMSDEMLKRFVGSMRDMAREGGNNAFALEKLSAAQEEMASRGLLTEEQADMWERNYEASKRYWDYVLAQEEKWKVSQKDVNDLLAGMADLLTVLGVDAAESVDAVLGFFESVDDMAADGIATWGELASMAAQTIATFNKVTDSASGMERTLGGAAMGAKLGYQFGGAWGAAIGAAIGGVAAFFRKPSWLAVGKEAGAILGMEVSKELAKTIEKTSKDLKISVGAATLLNLSAAMEESGRDARTFATQVVSLMEGIRSGTIPAKQGLEELGKAFGAIRDAAQAAGTVGDAALVGILKNARQLGGAFYTDEMKAFVDEKLGMAVEGLKKLVGSMDDFKKSAESTKFPTAGLTMFGGDASAMSKAASDQATVFMGVFNAMLSEKGMVGAFDALGETFDVLMAKLKAVGSVAGVEGAEAILAPFARLRELMGNETFRGAAESADALKAIMVGLADSGYLDINTFQALQAQALQSFSVMTDSGATSQEALMALAPTIQAAISAAEQFGVPLSADMQHLRDMAEQNGITFNTDPMRQMVEILKSIAVVLGAEIPASLQQTSTAATMMSTSTTQTFGATAAEAANMATEITTTWDAGMDLMTVIGEETGEELAKQFQGEGMVANQVFDAIVGDMQGAFGQMAGVAEDAVSDVKEIISQLPSGISIPIDFPIHPPDLGSFPGSTNSGSGTQTAAAGFYSPSMPTGSLPDGGTPLIVHPREEVFVGKPGEYPGAQGKSRGVALNLTLNFSVSGYNRDPRELAAEIRQMVLDNVEGLKTTVQQVSSGQA